VQKAIRKHGEPKCLILNKNLTINSNVGFFQGIIIQKLRCDMRIHEKLASVR
jgi:hypothetical protein